MTPTDDELLGGPGGSDVPGHPGWYYGLERRGKGGVLHVLVHKKGSLDHFEVYGHKEWADIHAEADRRIKERAAR